MADESLEQAVVKTIADQLGIEVSEVTKEKSFIDDLGADSLDLTELIMTLEEKFTLEISDEEAEGLKTVNDVISFICSKHA